MHTPLGDLASFLGYAEATPALKPVFEALAETLADAKHRAALTERASRTVLHLLVSFLGYAEATPKLKPVFTALCEDLSKQQQLESLAASMAEQPLDGAVAVLRADVSQDLWRAVFAEVDAERWRAARSIEPAPKPYAFVAFQRIASELRRPELAQAPARRIVVASSAADWQQPAIGLHHLSHVVRLAMDAPADEMEAFLERVVCGDWLDRSYVSVSPGALAGNLLAFANSLDNSRSTWLRRDSLRQRIVREFSRVDDADPEAQAQALALLGAAAAIGAKVTAAGISWPSQRQLAAILAHRLPSPEWVILGPIQQQLWLGLYELACLRPRSPAVPPRLAEPMLALWIATAESDPGEQLPAEVRARNARVIRWLERSRDAGWRLVTPDVPLVDPIPVAE